TRQKNILETCHRRACLRIKKNRLDRERRRAVVLPVKQSLEFRIRAERHDLGVRQQIERLQMPRTEPVALEQRQLHALFPQKWSSSALRSARRSLGTSRWPATHFSSYSASEHTTRAGFP